VAWQIFCGCSHYLCENEKTHKKVFLLLSTARKRLENYLVENSVDNSTENSTVKMA
jgi:hypothetical protein